MSHEASEQEIRETAYGLWEQAGCPEGRDDEFWRQAEQTHAQEKKHAEVDTDSEETVKAGDLVDQT